MLNDEGGTISMRKWLLMILSILFIAFISGCSEEKTESGSSGLTLPDENGKEVSFENMDKPALVFFFTGVG
jgi:hypothetical protein